jgi:hypothetical protein
MAKIATAEFDGLTGKKYSFNVYSIDTAFKALPGVYCFTKRIINSKGSGEHTIIYVGITKDLSLRSNDHHHMDCINDQNANCICIHQEENEDIRMHIASDLIKKHKPHCNQTLK